MRPKSCVPHTASRQLGSRKFIREKRKCAPSPGSSSSLSAAEACSAHPTALSKTVWTSLAGEHRIHRYTLTFSGWLPRCSRNSVSRCLEKSTFMQLREPEEVLCTTLHPIRIGWPLNATVPLLWQVYVRRGYIAYELNSLQHRELPDGTCFVEFQFMLPSSHPNRYGGFSLFLSSLSRRWKDPASTSGFRGAAEETFPHLWGSAALHAHL